MSIYLRTGRLKTDILSYLRRDQLRLLTMANVLVVSLLWAAELSAADRFWPVTLITYAPQHLLLIPALALSVRAWMRRRRRLLLLNIGTAALVLVGFLGFNVPFARLLHPSGRTIRLMSYNIHHADDRLPMVLSAIRRARPDILCLQEGDGIHGSPDPTARIAAELPGWRLFRRGEVAVLTRFPIISANSYRPPYGSASSTLQVVVDVGGCRLTVVAAHLLNMLAPEGVRNSTASFAGRLEEVSRVRDGQCRRAIGTADLSEPPVVIAGDFNTPPRGTIYRRLATRYRDSFRDAGWGFGSTYPSADPLLRIDYAFTGEGVRTARAFTASTTASDHRPLVVELRLSNSECGVRNAE